MILSETAGLTETNGIVMSPQGPSPGISYRRRLSERFEVEGPK